jgi:hypothetical protein
MASTLSMHSAVKRPMKTHSTRSLHEARSLGASGSFSAIVSAFSRISSSTARSNHGCSTASMARRRARLRTEKSISDLPSYSYPLVLPVRLGSAPPTRRKRREPCSAFLASGTGLWLKDPRRAACMTMAPTRRAVATPQRQNEAHTAARHACWLAASMLSI